MNKEIKFTASNCVFNHDELIKFTPIDIDSINENIDTNKNISQISMNNKALMFFYNLSDYDNKLNKYRGINVTVNDSLCNYEVQLIMQYNKENLED